MRSTVEGQPVHPLPHHKVLSPHKRGPNSRPVDADAWIPAFAGMKPGMGEVWGAPRAPQITFPKNVRRSATSNSGESLAAKCPPLGISVQ